MQLSPIALASTWDLVASDYAVEIAPAFEYFAREALRLTRVARGQRVVDVACGPGTLALLAAELGAEVEAIDFSPKMVAALHARGNAGAASRAASLKVNVQVGDGMALPYGDRQFDAGFSMFGLMFFPDRSKGFRELARVLKPGARAVVASWVPIVKNPLVWAAVEALTQLTMPAQPSAPAPLPAQPSAPPPVLPLASPESCRAEMAAADFTDVTVHELVGPAQFASTAEMVASFGRSSAPFALNKQQLAGRWPEVEAEITRRVSERFGTGPQTVHNAAYLTVGVRG